MGLPYCLRWTNTAACKGKVIEPSGTPGGSSAFSAATKLHFLPRGRIRLGGRVTHLSDIGGRYQRGPPQKENPAGESGAF